MIVKELKVLNELGIHARVASRLVRCASGFESGIGARKNGNYHDFKNVLGVMTLGTKCGETVTVEIEGPDELDAAEAVEQLFAVKFGER